jgi:asparagine synthetase B (glutamine-hydrolysing)
MCIASDPRRLALPSMPLDDRSIYSVLQFGAIVPPMSLWKGVARFTPGCRHIVHADDLRIESHPMVEEWPAPEAADPTLAQSGQVVRVTSLHDDIIHEACPEHNAVILFSGGVDSGLLAARAAAMGWRDTLLVHYSMGDDDPETAQARTMAQHLGLTLEVVRDQDVDDLAVLDRVAAVWPQPTADTSTLPTHALSRSIIERLRSRDGGASRVILDGTGADGCFGMFGRAASWHSILRVPRAIRRAASRVYATGRLWRRGGAVERRLRLLRRSCQMPMLPAAVAQNALLDIAYLAADEARRSVLAAVAHWLEHALPCADDPARLAGLDLALVCANVFAQKNKPVFDASAHRIVYPFLDQRMVGLALRRAERWPASHDSKRVLKAALAEQVPPELVYRRKSAFVSRLRDKFAAPRFLSAFDRLFDRAAPLAPHMHNVWLHRVRRDIKRGRALPAQTYSCVWAATFTNLWLEQMLAARTH